MTGVQGAHTRANCNGGAEARKRANGDTDAGARKIERTGHGCRGAKERANGDTGVNPNPASGTTPSHFCTNKSFTFRQLSNDAAASLNGPLNLLELSNLLEFLEACLLGILPCTLML